MSSEEWRLQYYGNLKKQEIHTAEGDLESFAESLHWEMEGRSRVDKDQAGKHAVSGAGAMN